MAGLLVKGVRRQRYKDNARLVFRRGVFTDPELSKDTRRIGYKTFLLLCQEPLRSVFAASDPQPYEYEDGGKQHQGNRWVEWVAQ